MTSCSASSGSVATCSRNFISSRAKRPRRSSSCGVLPATSTSTKTRPHRTRVCPGRCASSLRPASCARKTTTASHPTTCAACIAWASPTGLSSKRAKPSHPSWAGRPLHISRKPSSRRTTLRIRTARCRQEENRKSSRASPSSISPARLSHRRGKVCLKQRSGSTSPLSTPSSRAVQPLSSITACSPAAQRTSCWGRARAS